MQLLGVLAICGLLATTVLADSAQRMKRATSSVKKTSTTSKKVSTSSKKSTSTSTKKSSTSASKTSSPSPSATVCNPQGTNLPSAPFWLETVKHQGTAPFNSDSSYQVFRNVKDFGAKGDGKTDDTAAINKAIQSGNRCYVNCQSSTTTPALVYFPRGTYMISAPIIATYYTQMIGDAYAPPTIKATSGFSGAALIDALPYNNFGQQYTRNQNNFFRMVRNLVIDTRNLPAGANAKAFHWPVAQATTITNVVINLNADSNSKHTGIYMENGSGGYMGDIVINGGAAGMSVGNQQFTIRNVTVNNAQSGILMAWNWGWTLQSVTFNNCQVGFDVTTAVYPQHAVGGAAIIDAAAYNTGIFLRTSVSSQGSQGKLSGSIVLNNVKLVNTPLAVTEPGRTILQGGTKTIAAWGQGNVYKGTSPKGNYTSGTIPTVTQDSSLLDSSGRVFFRQRLNYKFAASAQIISAKTFGCKGDGVTDDTACIKSLFTKYSGCNVLFFDAGVYIVTDTITIPDGTQMVGEAWTTIAGKGANFQDESNPRVVVAVGPKGSKGIAEISDFVFTTIGPAKGAIVMEFNMAPKYQGSVAMWDSHIRLGGATGSNLETENCKASSPSQTACASAFLGMHLTTSSSAYLESTWVWNADHDLDQQDGLQMISLFSGRGVLSESQGPVWFVGTGSEHHVMYQYSLINAKNHWMGLIQTESPYYQPSPPTPAPFTPSSQFKDPGFGGNRGSAWGLYIRGSSGIYVFGCNLYSFFKAYDTTCVPNQTCQNDILSIGSGSAVHIANLATVGTTMSLDVDDVPIIAASSNLEGTQQTATFWSWSGSK